MTICRKCCLWDTMCVLHCSSLRWCHLYSYCSSDWSSLLAVLADLPITVTSEESCRHNWSFSDPLLIRGFKVSELWNFSQISFWHLSVIFWMLLTLQNPSGWAHKKACNAYIHTCGSQYLKCWKNWGMKQLFSGNLEMKWWRKKKCIYQGLGTWITLLDYNTLKKWPDWLGPIGFGIQHLKDQEFSSVIYREKQSGYNCIGAVHSGTTCRQAFPIRWVL